MDFTAEENQEMRQWREEADREDDRECELARINALQTIRPRPEGMGPVLQGQFEDIWAVINRRVPVAPEVPPPPTAENVIDIEVEQDVEVLLRRHGAEQGGGREDNDRGVVGVWIPRDLRIKLRAREGQRLAEG